MNESVNNKRIAKNTLLLYIRTAITIFIGLYSSRLVLEVLGVDNYGIYNVVGGVIAMMGFFSGTLAASTQRFINYEMGKKENAMLQKIFSASFSIHLILAISLFFVFETIGLYVLNRFINIVPERMGAANVIYQISILVFVIRLVASPYNALIIAHERMDVFAYVSIFGSINKLLLIVFISELAGDPLLWWGGVLLILAVVDCLIYFIFSIKKYKESKLIKVKDKSLYKQLLSYIGWNLVGIVSATLSTQGINIISNIFFGVKVNAARGIATQVENVVSGFVGNFQTALNPQLVKSCSSKEYLYMNTLVKYGIKYSYFLLLVIAAPILINAKELLTVWLKTVPEYSVEFVRLTILFLLVQIISNPLITSITAVGKIRKYEIIISLMLFMNFLLSLGLFYFGASPVASYIVIVVNGFACFFIRVELLSKMIPINKSDIYLNVLTRCTLITIISLLIPFLIKNYWEYKSILGVLFMSFFSVAVVLVFVALFGLNNKEKKMAKSFILKKVVYVAHKN